ncbi:MAG: hypothetical protein WA004_00535 [Saprospiraceae bacterium]
MQQFSFDNKECVIINITLLLSLILLNGLLAQSTEAIKPGWYRIEITGIGTLDVPNSLEIQDGRYQEAFQSSLKETMEKEWKIKYNEPNITIQLSGTNNLETSTYVRFVLQTQFAQKGTFKKLHQPPFSSAEEHLNFEQGIRAKFEGMIEGSPIKITKWEPLEVVEIKNMKAKKIEYERRIGDGQPSIVQIYQIQNSDRQYTITITIPRSELKQWQPVLMEVLSSFQPIIAP